MPTQKPKDLTDDLAYLEILLEKILELVEKGVLELKASDALKIIELKHKLFRHQSSKEELLRPLIEMFERAGKAADEYKEKNENEKETP